MSVTDPIGDMLCRMRNALAAGKAETGMPSSKLRLAVAKVLKDEGYIADFTVQNREGKNWLQVALKYHDGVPVMETIRRVSRPGLRVYRGKNALPKVMGGLGIAIISTPKGVVTDRTARALGQGGEILCTVS